MSYTVKYDWCEAKSQQGMDCGNSVCKAAHNAGYNLCYLHYAGLLIQEAKTPVKTRRMSRKLYDRAIRLVGE